MAGNHVGNNLQFFSGAFLKKQAISPFWPGQVAPVEPLRFRRVPLLAAALAFCVGDLLARPAAAWRPAVTLLGFAVVLISLSLASPLLRLRRGVALLAVLALWVVVGFWSAEMQPAAPAQSALVGYADGLSRTVRGHVVRVREIPPRKAAEDSDGDVNEWEETQEAATVSVDLAVDSVEQVTPDTSTMVPVTGGIRVTLSGRYTQRVLRCGDAIEAPLRLQTPERYRDPGAWQYADYLATEGIGAHGTVAASRLKVQDAGDRRPGVRCMLYAAQSWAGDRMLAFAGSRPNRMLPKLLRLTPDDAGSLNAMLFGDRARLNHQLRLGFERTGSFHLFVVSGMHVALLAGAIFYLARRLRVPQATATVVTLMFTLAYALLTGFGAPVQRALLMSSVFLVARLLQREPSVLNALGAAVLGVLVLSPSTLYESGFQMTMLAILAIAGIAVPLGAWSFGPYLRATRKLDHLWLDFAVAPKLAEFRIVLRIYGEHLEPLFGRRARGIPAGLVRCCLYLIELLLVGVVAEMVMVLPMALYFHRATIFALPANVFSIPFVAILAPLALATFLLTLISPWLAVVPASATACILHVMTGIIGRIGGLQIADWRVPGPTFLVAGIAFGGWLACGYLVRRSRNSASAAAGVLPVLFLLVLWPEAQVFTPGMLEVTALDVGQGDSLLVVSPEGRTMLIDAGGPVGRAGDAVSMAATSGFDTGEDVVSPYLWSRRIRHLDVVVLTHAHSDHMGGMPAILRNFRPRELWVGVDPRSSAYTALIGEAAHLGIMVRHVRSGDAMAFGGLAVAVLAPDPGYKNAGVPVNNDSVVLRIEYGRASALLEGDAEAPSEHAMVTAGAIRPVTLLKVGHHGSRTSTTPEFFAAAAPREAVISVGQRNTFGHPRQEVISRIAATPTRLYRTDRFGLAQFLLTKDGQIQEIGVEAGAR